MSAGSSISSAPSADEQSAARELVRTWAAGASVVDAARDVEHGDAAAWRVPYAGLAQLGIFGVALPEEHGGADGTIADLCAMLDEAAAALVPGPVATTALATLLLGESHADLLEQLAVGARTAGIALTGDVVSDDGRVSGTAPYVLGATADGVLVLPAGDGWVLVDAAAGGVRVEPLAATDFSRPLARVTLDGAAAEVLPVSGQRVVDLTATVLAAEAAGLARRLLNTATEYAKVREQFGKPIGSFQAIKHMCAEMLLRSEQASVAAADAAQAASDIDTGIGDGGQLSLAAALAASVGIEAAKANAKDCIQVLGGIGITWEHDAHLYLRRAYGIAQFLGGRSRWLRRVAALTRQGVRRELHIDLASVAHLRPEIAASVADVAAVPDQGRQPALADAGLLAPHWPRPYGRAAGPAEQLLIDQELAAAGVVRPDLVIGWWAVPTLLEHGSPSQVEQFVPATLRGELTWCQLFSEPGAGSDLAALRTKAVRTEGGWKLTGQKVWTSAAQQAHWGVCLARTDADAPKHKGITYFLIDMKSPGIVIRPLREITGDELFNEVFFDDVFVPDEMVVGNVNDGWRLARTTLSNERVAMAQGTALGNPMEELLQVVAELDLDAAQQDQLGSLIVTAQVGSLLDQRIAQLAVGGRDPGPEASARKLIGVRHRQGLAEFRMDVSEGAGAVVNQQVHAFLNTRCLTIAGGTEQILLTMAGERLLGLPR
ncbi:acyl-CoA dehydrogenase [Mycobacterium sp. Y57]|uniref:acyl-CoA dehydrogenase n=1 Tax=Mycolicibacterium xanthum TaxID=2796469 RepID=UPI001C847E91|nr:acyl-CoA dehydrogenase [Mycolicibacterium xanthum]MBX7431308.1 acyl-CoA dehydrogenase [Mycolicibacterium xanthum]